jgi:hypothetical protein
MIIIYIRFIRSLMNSQGANIFLFSRTLNASKNVSDASKKVSTGLTHSRNHLYSHFKKFNKQLTAENKGKHSKMENLNTWHAMIFFALPTLIRPGP